MASDQIDPVAIIGIKGRNGSDSTLMIPGEQCLEALNVDWFRSSLGRKRGGADAISLATGGTAFASGVVSMQRYVPGDDQTAQELWALDGARNFHRLAASVTWASPTVVDACTATPQEAVWLGFNGNLYVAYKSAHNRLHRWDGTSLRRVGLDLPAVPTVVEAGGAITDTRKYRIAWTKQVSGVTVLRSNLSVATAAATLTAEQATVTRSTAPGEGETHWELYGASTTSAFGDYRLIATAIIATTSAVDNAALPTDTAPDDGANTPPPSCRYMVSDGAKVIMAGAYELPANAENAVTPKNNRVWWTSQLGSSDIGDDERVSLTGTINAYDDVEEAITGISEPFQGVASDGAFLERGSFFVFSWGAQWKYVATDDATDPYTKFRVTNGRGCIHHKSIVTAHDADGHPSIYWASQDGPMRATKDGQQFIGEDVVDLWATINLDATIPCHSVAIPYLKQVWMYIATGTSLYPNKKIVFDTRLGRVTEADGVRFGWSLHTGESAKAYCSCLFSDSIGATMGRKLKPFIGYTESTALWKCDTSALNDAGNQFQAYIDSRSYAPWGLGNLGSLSEVPIVVATAQQGVTLRLTIYRNEAADESYFDADLTDLSDTAAASKVFARFEGAKFADSYTFRCRIGDSQTTDYTWNLDALIFPMTGAGH